MTAIPGDPATYPALRDTVRAFLTPTILGAALAGEQMGELVSDLIDAHYREGYSGLWNTLQKAGCDAELCDQLAEQLHSDLQAAEEH